jgi:hypothetical protein
VRAAGKRERLQPFLCPGNVDQYTDSAFPNDDAIDVACLVPALVNLPFGPRVNVVVPRGGWLAREQAHSL